MELIRKTDPIGVDKVIDFLQVHLDNNLSWTDTKVFPRIYKEENREGLIKPMLFFGKKDYRSVFLKDSINSVFFYHSDSTEVSNGIYPTTISIVFQLLLDKIYTSSSHRFDEEAISEVLLALEKQSIASIKNVVRRVKNVYSEFDTAIPKNHDIGRFFVFRIDLSSEIIYKC